MTNKVDGFKERIAKQGEATEFTEGVPENGFIDPNGEFPARDFFYGSSLSKAATGGKINALYAGGGDYGVDASVADQKPSQYPFNQAQETQSGHSFEMDDTPGGERILVKHRTGAGLELRADGSVIFASRGKKVSITGGDEVVIIEGKADVVYKGDLNLRVAGDYNLEVEGNYNLNVGGNSIEKINGRRVTTIDKDHDTVIRGGRSRVVGNSSNDTVLGDVNLSVKGNLKQRAAGDMEIRSGNILTTSGVAEWVASAKTASIIGTNVSLIGDTGTVGGAFFDFFGKTYGGAPAVTTQLTTFYGSLVGRATESFHADYSMFSSVANVAVGAVRSVTAMKDKGPKPNFKPKLKAGVFPYITMTQKPKTVPWTHITFPLLMTTKYGNHPVEIDLTKEGIQLRDEYDGAFNREPTIHEIRSKLRDSQWRENGTLTGYLLGKGLLSETYSKTIPKNVGRSANKDGTIRLGTTLLGNNAAETRSKRFKVK